MANNNKITTRNNIEEVGEVEYKLDVPRDIEEDKKESQRIDRLIFIGLILIVSILPLIMRAKVIDYTSPIITFNSILASGMQGDVFTYYKFMFLLIVTSILLGLFMYRTYVLGNSLVNHFSQYCFNIFIIIVTLSAIISPYKSIALFGIYNRHDGAITTVLVVILFFVASNLTYTKNRLLMIAYAFAPVVIINLIFGLSLFYGKDMLDISFIQKLIVPSSIGVEALGANSQLWTTINNPNYASGYAGMTTVLFLSLAVFLKEWLHKVLFFILSVASFILMLTSLSQSGFLAIIGSLVFLIILLIKFKNFKTTVPLLLVALILFTGSIYILQQHNNRIWTETFGTFNISNPFIKETAVDTEKVSQPNAFHSSIQWGNRAYASDEVEQKQIKLPEFPTPAISAGSGRLYIWDRTISLILERPLLGYGMDTIIYAFPQYEPEKQAGLGTMSTMVDKPHNIFIGIAYGTGILGLITFLVGTAIIVFKSLFAIFKNKVSLYTTFSAVLFLTLLAYLIQGIPNDAIIGSYPMFWILLGVIVALQKQVNMKQTSEV